MGSQQSAVLCYVFPEDNGDYTYKYSAISDSDVCFNII